jgi:hypothetical protein
MDDDLRPEEFDVPDRFRDPDYCQVPCPACGQPVSELADKCPHCGQWIVVRTGGGGIPAWILIAGLALILLIAALVLLGIWGTAS